MNSIFSTRNNRLSQSFGRLLILTALGASALPFLISSVLGGQNTADHPSKQAGKSPLKVFILAGQSNMEGQAVADLDGPDYNDGKGTLKFLLHDPAKAPRFQHLQDAQGRWTVRNDVWVRYQLEDGTVKAGPLTLGFTPYEGRHHFGPELQFGQVLGDHFTNQVLLIKTAWGGKSLYEDFRPPSSGGKVGPYYWKMLQDIHTALTNLKTDFPGYDGGGYELSGFVWYQGWNDGCDPKHAVPEYEQNLVNLIHDVRRDLGAPDLPVVIGELTGPWVVAPDEWALLRQAQAAAAAPPKFKGNVRFVETHDFVRPAADSPNPGHGHHEFGNAETYFLVGDALGKAIVELLPKDPDAAANAPILYRNAQYDFTFSLPASWRGYSVMIQEWEGTTFVADDKERATERGPTIVIRHPQWKASAPYQDIPILVFTRRQWDIHERKGIAIYAGGVEYEMEHNANYVFAIYSRFNLAEVDGWKEAQDIVERNQAANEPPL